MIKVLANLLGSQVILGVVGLATLPVIARALGVGAYGEFSLFIILIGAINNLEFVRPLFIKEYVGASEIKKAELHRVARVNIVFVVLVSVIFGWFFIDPVLIFSLCLIVLFQGLASPDYAWLALKGKVVSVNLVRNIIWSVTYLVITGGVLLYAEDFHYGFSFVIANMIVFLVYRYMSTLTKSSEKNIGFNGVRKYLSNALNISAFNLSGAVIVSVDKGILKDHVITGEFGQYSAQADLAIKMNMVSNAISNMLYPILTTRIAESGKDLAFVLFRKVFFWTLLAYFTVVILLIAYSDQIVVQIFGDNFLGEHNYYAVFLFGIFLHMFSFLIVPWQRALGNFILPRKVYSAAALIMLVLGLLLIPRYGSDGAILTYLSARLAEIFLLVHMLYTLPKGSVKIWEKLVIGVLSLCIGSAALWKSGWI